MTNQFLSLKKKKGQRKRDDFFDNNFDIREFYTKKKQALIYQREKKKPSKLASNKGGHDEEGMDEDTMRDSGKAKLYIEDMQFIRTEQLHEISFKEFLARLSDELKKTDLEYLEKKIGIFKGKKMSAQELFDCFVETFGLTKEVGRF